MTAVILKRGKIEQNSSIIISFNIAFSNQNKIDYLFIKEYDLNFWFTPVLETLQRKLEVLKQSIAGPPT